MNNELLGFLAGWVMEFGTKIVSGRERGNSHWYDCINRISVYDVRAKKYFDANDPQDRSAVRINQRGLAYIANGGENDPVLEFLAGWVMEFGTGPVAGDRRVSNKWYSEHPVSVFDHDEYFRYVHGAGHQINQRGLAYIAEGGGGKDERPRS